jgi:hypothetical protein
MIAKVSRANYEAYISSDQWRAVRLIRLRKDGNTCQGCGARERLHVHHRTYERFTCERISDLVTVCESCHALIHDLHRKKRGSLEAVTFKVITKPAPRKPVVKRQRRVVVRRATRRKPVDWREEIHSPSWARGARQLDETTVRKRRDGL